MQQRNVGLVLFQFAGIDFLQHFAAGEGEELFLDFGENAIVFLEKLVLAGGVAGQHFRLLVVFHLVDFIGVEFGLECGQFSGVGFQSLVAFHLGVVDVFVGTLVGVNHDAGVAQGRGEAGGEGEVLVPDVGVGLLFFQIHRTFKHIENLFQFVNVVELFLAIFQDVECLEPESASFGVTFVVFGTDVVSPQQRVNQVFAAQTVFFGFNEVFQHRGSVDEDAVP